MGPARGELKIEPSIQQALAHLGAGRDREAAGLCLQHLKRQPNDSIATQVLGIVAFRRADYSEAISRFSSVVDRDPKNPDALNNLGNTLCHVGREPEAIEHLETAIRLNPNLADAYSNLSRAYTAVGRMGDAINAGMKAATLNPQLPEAYLNMGTAFFECGAVRDALACYRRSDRRPNDLASWSNFLMALQYSAECSSQELKEAAVTWGRTLPQPFAWDFNLDLKPDRLRIGYVSGDLRGHPVGFTMKPILEQHDRSRVEVFCYSNQPSEDDFSKQLRNSSDHWRVIAGLNDLEAARVIQADGIHVLVDLSGHTAHNRLGVFALKPAPVQVSWLGYFATTGLSQIDFILRDAAQVPPSERSNYVEQIWPLTDAAFSFDGAGAPDLTPLPALRNGYITFGSFNNLGKISWPSMQAWASILRAIPGSILLLDRKPFGDPAVCSMFTETFAKLGIGPERLRMSACQGREAYFRLYEEVDIVLDTFPFNGGTTTYEALWMGVPVVSHRWDRMVGHFGESILGPVAHLEWVASSEEEMVRIATDLVRDLEGLVKLRQGLRDQMKASTLCRPDSCTRSLEDAFFGMWEAVGVRKKVA